MAKSKGTPEIDADIVRTLADLLHEKDLSEIEYSGEDWHVRVAKGTPGGTVISAPAVASVPPPAPAADAPKPADTVADHPGVVASPMVGTVYVSDEPDAPPFVSVGDSVAEGGKFPEIVQRVELPLIVIHFRRERFHCCLALVFQVESRGVCSSEILRRNNSNAFWIIGVFSNSAALFKIGIGMLPPNGVSCSSSSPP